MNWIDINTPTDVLQKELEHRKWLVDERILALEKAGEGNMNMVLKVTTDHRDLILKQSRPFVFKYPDLAAPVERIEVEFQFHQAILGTELSNQLPSILHYDASSYLMMMEYIAQAKDMVFLYQERKLSLERFGVLMDSLNVLHDVSVSDYPPNNELRALNHQHIFQLPFQVDNGFSLDDVQTGLQGLSVPYKQDSKLKSRVEALGIRYLTKGNTLLHGDYYPGSWMQTSDQVFIIDAEFSHLGFAEFDLGVMAAHLIMSTGDSTYLDRIMNAYTHSIDQELVQQMAGTEIMRRLIGLAQLPLERSLDEKQQLLKLASDLILN